MTARTIYRAVTILIGVVSALLLVLAPGAGQARAHDVVLHSTPADGSTVASFPRTIRLEFSAIPKDSYNTVAVSDADTGTVLFSDTPTREKQFMVVQVPDSVQPGPGHYIVGFQITSSDGHATRGKTTFTVGDAPIAAQSQPAAEQTQTAPTNNDGLSLGMIVALLAAVAVCVGTAITIKKRK